MGIKLGDKKSRKPISGYSADQLEQMMSSKNTPPKIKNKIKDYLAAQR